MNYENILYEKKGRITIISMNCEKNLNALSDGMKTDLKSAFLQFESDSDSACAILTGKGRAFMAGGDAAQMAAKQNETRDYFAENLKLTELIEEMSKPVIAAVNGFALGGGCELCLSCDFRIASTKAKFGQLESNLGVIPLMGGTQRLPRLVGKGMAKYMIFTGEMIDAAEAHRIGLVERVVEPDQLMPVCEDLAEKIAAKSRIIISLSKAAINLSARTDLYTGLAMETALAAESFATEDRVEGMTAFLEKRDPVFKNR